ncbi:transposase [Methylobacterium radiotolerans]|uniref:transposase n=1 Tax=Methylobacterium radiotolerans TaxID=31998 RepID=UPI00399D1676
MPDQNSLFWLKDDQWTVIEPHLPTKARQLDDRRILSGIIYVSLNGCRWADCPRAYGPLGSTYRRFSQWRHRAFWRAMRAALSNAGWTTEAKALDPVAVARARPKRRGLRVDRKWRGGVSASGRQAPD